MKLFTKQGISYDLPKWIGQYDKYLKRNDMAENTILAYHRILNRFNEYIQEHSDIECISKIESDVILDFIEFYEEQSGSKYSTATKNLYIIVLKGFLEFIELKADILDNGVQFKFNIVELSHRKSRKNKKRSKFKHLNNDDVNLLLEYFDTKIDMDTKTKHYNYVYSLATRLMLFAGLRVSECLNLKLSNLKVDDDGIVDIELEHTKSGEEQEVPIQLKHIEKELNYLTSLANSLGLNKDEAYLIANKQMNTPLDRSNLYAKMKNIYKSLGINKSGLHILRHTSAMMLLSKSNDITYVQKLLRHSDINTTTIYAKRMNKDLKKQIL